MTTTMTGSAKQITWATTLRTEYLKKHPALASAAAEIAEASFWIDHRRDHGTVTCKLLQRLSESQDDRYVVALVAEIRGALAQRATHKDAPKALGGAALRDAVEWVVGNRPAALSRVYYALSASREMVADVLFAPVDQREWPDTARAEGLTLIDQQVSYFQREGL